MTYLLNSEFSTITINSDIIDDYIQGLPTPAYTITLTVSYNAGTDIVIPLTSMNLDVPNTQFILTPEDVLQQDIFSEGIYSLRLNQSNISAEESLCIPVLITLPCRVMAYAADLIERKDQVDSIPFLLNLLQTATNTCAECNCNDALSIYNYIVEVLNTGSITEDCGCTD